VAKATFAHTGVKIVLELDEAEAQYVEAALRNAVPTHFDGDPVWDELGESMRAAGVVCDATAAA
jgi:hypothetical protein